MNSMNSNRAESEIAHEIIETSQVVGHTSDGATVSHSPVLAAMMASARKSETQRKSEAQHTPGPWRWVESVDEDAAVLSNHRYGEADPELICVLGGDTMSPQREGESEANAQRIVAAVNACEGIPTSALESGVVGELLAVCERCIETAINEGWYFYRGTDEAHAGFVEMRAAIAKARGAQEQS